MKTKCSYCNIEIDRRPSRIKNNNFCNASHQMLHQYSNGKNKNTTNARIALSEKYGNERPYLKGKQSWISGKSKENSDSVLKMAQNRLGSNNPMWKENKTAIRPNKNYAWHIKKRDDFKCRLCKYDKDLNVHHIKFWKDTQDNSEQNLITLCKYCHKKMHDIYRNKMFTEYEQLLRN